MDEMQNYCHYDEFYGVFGSIIKGDLKEGKWYFLEILIIRIYGLTLFQMKLKRKS